MLAALVVAGGCVAAGHVLPSVSPLLLAIVAGMTLANTLSLPSTWEPGTALAGKRLLRAGIVLLGLQLSLRDVAALGPATVGVAVAVVAAGVLGSLWVGRLLGVPKRLRLLIACGFSICGAAAVAGVEGVVDAEEEDVAAAVGLVVAFGTLMIPAAPALGLLLGLDPHARAELVGASVHEVAQVVAAGGLVGGSALGVAVVMKLARVAMLAPVVAVIGWRRRAGGRSAGPDPRSPGVRRPGLVPLFVVGFLAAVLVRTSGVLPEHVLTGAGTLETLLLSAAMFGLGCGVRVGRLRRLGGRPVALGAVATVLVTTVAAGGVVLTS